MAEHYAQSDIERIFGGRGRAYRKRARIIAFKAESDFTIETDRGRMTGVAGDWIARNHPEDDPNSDMWSISDERMENTYEESE